MTTPDPPDHETRWTPPRPLVVTDFQWRLNCLKAQIEPEAGEPPAWLHQPKGKAS